MPAPMDSVFLDPSLRRGSSPARAPAGKPPSSRRAIHSPQNIRSRRMKQVITIQLTQYSQRIDNLQFQSKSRAHGNGNRMVERNQPPEPTPARQSECISSAQVLAGPCLARKRVIIPSSETISTASQNRW